MTRSAPAWRPVAGVAACAALLGLLAVWVFAHQLFDHWSFPWDFLGTYTTTPAFVAATVGHAHPVSWSPFVAGGFPVDVDAQGGFYYPGWWALGVAGIPATLRVLTAVQIIHVVFGALGALALARTRGLQLKWALGAGVAYLFFGGFYGQAEHADIVRGFAYLPWLLWSLTPPAGARLWWRLLLLPLLAWVISSGAYPGEVVSFALMGFVYTVFALRGGEGGSWRRHLPVLALAIVASAAVCAVVLLPYLRAEQAGELHRAIEPTAQVRAMWAMKPLDVLGLYLNNFAWTPDGTVTSWGIGVPILLGLSLLSLNALRRQLPLVAAGILAVLLAFAPKIGPIGDAMAWLKPLFPSRFPASDYKAGIALALIVLSLEGWSGMPPRTSSRALRVGVAALVLVVGLLAAPSTHALPTKMEWLVIVVIALGALLAVVRPPARIVAAALVVLIVADGMRLIHDYRLDGTNSPWQVEPAALAYYVHRDGFVRDLRQDLDAAPEARPARVPPAPTAEPNASGWVADAYHLADYDPTVELSQWRVERAPALTAVMLQPWHAFTFSCAAVGCGKLARLPAVSTWKPSAQVHTVRYGTQSITYEVHISHPAVMVENELAVDGWNTSSPYVRPIDTGLPLRAWRLAPGSYTFTAAFQEPGRGTQYAALAVALASWIGCGVLLSMRRRKSRVRPRAPAA